MKSHILLFFSTLLLCLMPFANAEVITIESKDGRQMIVSLMARQGDQVVLKRAKDGKEFTIDPSSLSEKSKKLILAKMKTLQVAYPPLEATVTIGQRRNGSGDSWTRQVKVTSKITLINKDYKVPCPKCSMSIIFIGQDQTNKDRLKVLSNQNFQLTPTPKSQPVEGTPFLTDYYRGYSDYGYKYVGYLLVVTDPDNKRVIYTKTTSSLVRKALEANTMTAKNLKSYPQNTLINANMQKPKVTAGGIIKH